MLMFSARYLHLRGQLPDAAQPRTSHTRRRAKYDAVTGRRLPSVHLREEGLLRAQPTSRRRRRSTAPASSAAAAPRKRVRLGNRRQAGAAQRSTPSAVKEQHDNHVINDANNADEDADEDDTMTIFVSVPSYRDPECRETVRDLLAKARHPQRVFVGVFEQNDASADAGIGLDLDGDPALAPFRSQVRIARADASEAKGPVWARHVIERELYQNEMFVLNIDSHMRFVRDWDALCIEELLKCPSEKPVLSTFPMDYEDVLDVATAAAAPHTTQKKNNNNAARQRRDAYQRKQKFARLLKSPPPFLTFHDWQARTKFPLVARSEFRSRPSNPQRSLFWAAGFSFTLGQCWKEVPYDPRLTYVFVGEEAAMNARLFTHGWDVFAPSRHLVFHRLDRAYRPLFWEQLQRQPAATGPVKPLDVDADVRAQRRAERASNEARIFKMLLGDDDGKDEDGEDGSQPRYGLGAARTLEAFWQFIGLDFQHQKVTSARAIHGVAPSPSQAELLLKTGLPTLPGLPRGTSA